MPIYRYTAVGLQGEPVQGEHAAADARGAREELTAAGLRVETLVEAPSAAAPAAAASTLSLADSVELGAHLAELAKAGLPLPWGLRALADELPRGRLARACRELAAKLDAGMPLEQAIESRGARLPGHVRGLLLAGVRSGTLADVLEQFLTHQRMVDDLRRRTALAVAYPTVLLVFLLGWFIFMLVWLARPMAKIFADFGTDLPVITRQMLWLAKYGPSAIAVGVALIAVFLLLARAIGGAGFASDLLSHVPLLGPLWRYRGLAEFSSLLSVLLGQNIPLPAALQLTAGALRDASIAAACRRSADRVAAGQSLADCVARQRAFPATLRPMVQWGQNVSALPEALRTAAQLFQGRLEMQAGLLRTIVPPIMFLVLGATALLFVSSMFLPLIKLIHDLS